MFGKNPFPVTHLCQFLTFSALVTGIPVSADQPAWWTQVGADGQSVISSNAPVSDPKSLANIGQAKFMAKRALESLRPILPQAASAIEANLVGPGKAIPTWDAPAPGSSLARAQFAPLLIGQLKAIADPFYTALRDTDSEWIIAELETNGTLDTENPDNFLPWTADPADDENKAIATLGQLKAVFSLRFESILETPESEEPAVPDEDVTTELTDPGGIQFIPPPGAGSGPGTTELTPQNYDILFKKGELSLKKYGYKPLKYQRNDLNKTRRYLTYMEYVEPVNPHLFQYPRLTGYSQWRIGFYLSKLSSSTQYDWPLDFGSRRTSVKNTLNGSVSMSGASFDENWFSSEPLTPINTNSNEFSPAAAQGEWSRTLAGPPAFESGLPLSWQFDVYPWANPWLEGADHYLVAPCYYQILRNENTIEMVKDTATENPPDYKGSWTIGRPWATWDVWENKMGVTYSRIQFKFHRKNSNPGKVTAGIFFTPEEGGAPQLVKSVHWNGEKINSTAVTVDPAKLKLGKEGIFHIDLGSIRFELDRAQQKQREDKQRVIIVADNTNNGGGGPEEQPTPAVRFPGMDDRWFNGANITLSKVSGSGSVRFKAVDPATGNSIIVPIGNNLAPGYFSSGGSFTGRDWEIEGVDSGTVSMRLSYFKGGTTLTANRQATVVSGDMDIDSDNSGSIATADADKIAEENIENDLTMPGKFIAVRPEWLRDADGIPNSVDGLEEVRVDASGFLPTDEITFKYSGSLPGVLPSRGSIRIWKKPLSGPPTSVAEFIVPGHPYTLSEIGLVPGTSELFYVQAVSPTTTKAAIEVQLSANGVVVVDTVMATLLPVNLDVNGDGDLADSWDGLATYMPGYVGNQAVLHTGSSFQHMQYAPQSMNLIIDYLPSSAVDNATVRIISASEWFGFCGNGRIPNDSPISPFKDFSLTGQETVASTQEATIPISGQKMIIPIFCHDYGASCEVEITLMKNGTAIVNPIKLTLPFDDNEDKLADRWQDAEITAWNNQFGTFRPLNDAERDKMKPGLGTDMADYADDELADWDGPGLNMPAMADAGDVLRVVEEYRGYVLDGGPGLISTEHRRLSITRKEALFQFLVMPQITSGANPGNYANIAAQAFDAAQRFKAVQGFYNAKFPNGGANLDCYMVELPLIPDASALVVYQDTTTRPAYLPMAKLKPIQGHTRPANALTYVYFDERLLDENSIRHEALYSPNLATARNHAFARERSAAEALGGPRSLDRFTVCAFYNRFGIYSDATNWSLGVIERDPSSSSNHLGGGTLSSPMVDPTPWMRGCQFSVNAISEQYPGLPAVQDFDSVIEYSIAHEIGHTLIWARDAGHPGSLPGLMANPKYGETMPTSVAQVKIQDYEISSVDLLNRASVIK